MINLGRKILVSNIGYFCDQLYQFIEDSSGKVKLVPATEEFKPFITILSIKHYQERIKTYPVSDKDTVKKALKFECKAENVFAQIGNSRDNETHVNLWQIDNQTMETFQGILIPETFLLANNKHLLCVNSPLYQCPLYCYSNEVISSSLATNIIKTPELFLYSIGVASDCSIEKINAEQMAALLLSNIQKKFLSVVKIFNRFQIKNLNPLLKPLFLSFIVGGSFYLTATSIALYIQQQQIETALSSTAKTASHLISLENKLNKETERYNLLLGQLKQKNSFSILWPIIDPILKDANLSNISFEQTKYILRGTANNASKILALLINDKRLVNAQFDTPVRKYRGKDNFVISFSLSTQSEL